MTSPIKKHASLENKDKHLSSEASFVKSLFKGLIFGLTLTCVSLLVVAFIIPRIIGAVPLTVLSGSMTPTFNPGDLIITMPVNNAKEEVKRGDIITFQPESGVSTLITHRVVSTGFTIDGDILFITKGDANSSQDAAILEEQVMGEYLYRIPYIGYLANAIPNDLKPLAIQFIGLAILGWAFIQTLIIIFTSGRNRRKNPKGDTVDSVRNI